MDEMEMEEWLTQPELEAVHNVFVITDDDETNTWGQAGTLEGLEGEIVGYTVLQFRKNEHGYHFLCLGAVDPDYRHRNAGRALLICALNRARMLSEEFEIEAEQADIPIYFEALLPLGNPISPLLAKKCEMEPGEEPALEGTKLYRRRL